MVAVRRTPGSGTVVGLVVFVVLTILAAGLAIWQTQQASAAKKALRENQADFQERVADYFVERNWELATEDVRGPYGIQYGPSSYDSVKSYLEQAATYERMTQLLGWQTVEGVEEAMRVSPLQKEQEVGFVTLGALLGEYERKFQGQTIRIDQLQGDLKSAQNQVVQKDKAFTDMQGNLRDQITADGRKYAADLSDWKEKYDKVLAAHTEQRTQTEDWKRKYEEAVAGADQKIADLEKAAEDLNKRLDVAVRGEEKPETLVAEGKVIEVEWQYNLVIIEGGEDVQRAPNEKLVVYSESPSGERLRKGMIIVTKVHARTASASVVKEYERIDDGDAFVNLELWNKFQEVESVPAEGTES